MNKEQSKPANKITMCISRVNKHEGYFSNNHLQVIFTLQGWSSRGRLAAATATLDRPKRDLSLLVGEFKAHESRCPQLQNDNSSSQTLLNAPQAAFKDIHSSVRWSALPSSKTVHLEPSKNQVYKSPQLPVIFRVDDLKVN